MTRLVIDESLRRLGLKSSRPLPLRLEQGEVGSVDEIVPGSRVRVRSADEIAKTLNKEGKLRGLWFDREMLPYCGTTATVKAQVKRFIDERTGAMVELKSDCFILDGVVCRGHVSEGRWFCCREIYPWWRGAWLAPEVDSTSAHPRAVSEPVEESRESDESTPTERKTPIVSRSTSLADL